MKNFNLQFRWCVIPVKSLITAFWKYVMWNAYYTPTSVHECCLKFMQRSMDEVVKLFKLKSRTCDPITTQSEGTAWNGAQMHEKLYSSCVENINKIRKV